MNDDLISREDLKKKAETVTLWNGDVRRFVSYKTIDNAPTIEQECYITGAQWNEFMKEHKRPHGEWILIDDVNDPLDRLNRYKCSECGRIIRIYDGQTFSDYPYCHCGAKMKGGAE